jgi:hypothetical protein
MRHALHNSKNNASVSINTDCVKQKIITWSRCNFIFSWKFWYCKVPVAARSKTWVCGRSHAGISGSKPARAFFFSCECSVLSCRGFYHGLITRTEESIECHIRIVWVHPVVYWWDTMYQCNDQLTQLFTKYKYIWLRVQCFDPYLGHRQTYIMNLESVVHVQVFHAKRDPV